MDIDRLKLYDDYEKVVSNLILPIHSFCDINNYGIKLPREIQTNYTLTQTRLETFSRMLLGASMIKVSVECQIIYFQKIKNGTNPNSHLYWGEIHDYSQTIVEMFSILLFCLRNIEQFKQSFSEKEITDFQRWFLQINKVKVYDNNWHFFPILINQFLKKLGLSYSLDCISNEWERIDKFYLGNGWYSDGNTKQRDYYIAFAFHFYSLLYALYSSDKSRNDIIIERANLFAKSYIHFFSESGASIPFGRSLTYKFAQIAFWSIYSLFVEDRTTLGIFKGIINRNLRFWLSQNILDKDGILTNGYAYTNPYLLEQYNGAGSPYWVFKAFSFLLNPKSLFFEVEEMPLPEREQSIYISEAFASIHHTGGHSFAFINGQSNDWLCQKTAKYEKFAYSSLFGFCVNRSYETLESLSPDSTLVVKIGNTLLVRNSSTVVYNDNIVQISDWNPIPSVCIRTYIFTGAPWHTRVHYIVSDTSITIFDCGYPVSSSTNYISDVKVQCSMKGTISCAPNSNTLYKQVSIPYATRTFDRGINIISNAFFGNCTKDGYDTSPDLTKIQIKYRRLYAYGTSYPLPNVATSKICTNLLIKICSTSKNNILKIRNYASNLLHKGRYI